MAAMRSFCIICVRSKFKDQKICKNLIVLSENDDGDDDNNNGNCDDDEDDDSSDNNNNNNRILAMTLIVLKIASNEPKEAFE
jgi:hypothetical protein